MYEFKLYLEMIISLLFLMIGVIIVKIFLAHKILKRTCTNPPPSNNGKPCIGPDMMKKSCNLVKCPEWQNWSEFSACSKECGTGVQTKTRVCKVYEKGQHCTGHEEETRSCSGQKCPIGNFQHITFSLFASTDKVTQYNLQR